MYDDQACSQQPATGSQGTSDLSLPKPFEAAWSEETAEKRGLRALLNRNLHAASLAASCASHYEVRPISAEKRMASMLDF